MEPIQLAKKLRGIQTVDSVMKKLGVRRSTAIKYLHFLRKEGFVETSGGGTQPRLYRIKSLSPIKVGNPGMYRIINRYSPLKIAEPVEHRIVGRRLTVEETLIQAITTRRFRTILASLVLFNKIRNWAHLYTYAKERDCRNKVGALYELARRFIKVRKIDRRIQKRLLKARDKEKYIIPHMKTKDFKDLEKKYGIFIPFNKADMGRLKQ